MLIAAAIAWFACLAAVIELYARAPSEPAPNTWG